MTLTQALAKLHKAGLARVGHLDGMKYHFNDRPGSWRPHDGSSHTGTFAAEPDLTDPATVGCLMALLREASGDPWAVVDANYALPTRAWWIQLARMGFIHGDTEGEAIANAIITLAERP